MTTNTNTIRKIGNGHFIPLSAATLGELNLRAGQEVTITTDLGALVVRTVNDDYTKTRSVASGMINRYRRALIKLGREGEVA
jgi:antitoxin component of MazEF toxin-antitoxin module